MYIGTALNVAATGLSIHKACTVSGEEKCRRAQYVESSASNGPRRRQPPGGGYAVFATFLFVQGLNT